MNIYFAGSIKGNPGGKELYPMIISTLQQHGTVLTEIFQWSHNTPNPKQYSGDQEIFEQDIDFLNKSNILIAEVTGPSHGCGREICYAQYVRQIPVICIYLEGTKVSSMIMGNDYIDTYSYTEKNLTKTIQHIFSSKHLQS